MRIIKRISVNVSKLLLVALFVGVSAPSGGTAKADANINNGLAAISMDGEGSGVTGAPAAAEVPDVTGEPAVTGEHLPTIAPESFAISESSLKLGLGKTKTITSNAITGGSVSVVWTSSNSEVASVTDHGKVRAEMPGNTVITASLVMDGVTAAERTCAVTVTKKKVAYSKMRSRIYGNRNKNILFADSGKSKCTLTLFGIYRSWDINPSAGFWLRGLETITVWPVISATKSGSSSVLTFDIKIQSVLQLRETKYRKFKKVIFTGGGEKVKISGSSTSKLRRYSGSNARLIKTKGTYRISKDSATRYPRLDKLQRIVKSKNAKIKMTDSLHGKTYTIKLTDEKKGHINSMIKKYKKIMKIYG